MDLGLVCWGPGFGALSTSPPLRNSLLTLITPSTCSHPPHHPFTAWQLQYKGDGWVNAESAENKDVSWGLADTKCFDGDNVNPNQISAKHWQLYITATSDANQEFVQLTEWQLLSCESWQVAAS